MAAVPSAAIIFVNNDLSTSAQAHLVRQLFITDVLDGDTFDAYFNDDASDGYADGYGAANFIRRRIMVIRSFEGRGTVDTWSLADVVIFVKQGLASVERNKFGPPGLTLPVLKLTWGALGIL